MISHCAENAAIIPWPLSNKSSLVLGNPKASVAGVSVEARDLGISTMARLAWTSAAWIFLDLAKKSWLSETSRPLRSWMQPKLGRTMTQRFLARHSQTSGLMWQNLPRACWHLFHCFKSRPGRVVALEALQQSWSKSWQKAFPFLQSHFAFVSCLGHAG